MTSFIDFTFADVEFVWGDKHQITFLIVHSKNYRAPDIVGRFHHEHAGRCCHPRLVPEAVKVDAAIGAVSHAISTIYDQIWIVLLSPT